MSFKGRVHRSAARRIAQWHLPDGVLVDVYLQLERLGEKPSELLFRTEKPYDGLTYPFVVQDRSNRECQYLFVFHVKYSVDEQTIWVKKGGYVRRMRG